MAYSETIMISATPEEVVSLMRRIEASVSPGRNTGVTEARIDNLVLDIEEIDIYPGFYTAMDVYGTSRENAKENARSFFGRLSEATPWRLALGFDENDVPIIERPTTPSGEE
ncbi:hypothetical protein [Nocardiopsis sp. NPDC055824]